MEAPRWYWSGEHVEESVRKETERALTLTSPGPHAFLLLVPVGQFTEVGCDGLSLKCDIVTSVLYTKLQRIGCMNRRNDFVQIIDFI